MTPFFLALWLLCSLATVVFATRTRTLAGWASLVIGFNLGIFVYPATRLPDATWTAALVACVSAAQIAGKRWCVLTAAAAGLLSGLIPALIQTQGVPRFPAVFLAALLPLASAIMSNKHSHFAPKPLYEEALVGLLVFAILLAGLPEILAGWRSAVALNELTKRSPLI